MNMLTRFRHVGRSVVATWVLALSLQAADTVLPVDAAMPLGTGGPRGFLVRTVQAPDGLAVANNFLRAVRQLDGTLTDTNGNRVPNIAPLGPGPKGTYPVATINFELDGEPFAVVDWDTGNVLAAFDPDPFPGIDPAGSSRTNFASEVVGFVELAAGRHTFSVCVGTSNTDAMDDDSYRVFVSPNPRDCLGVLAGQFERTSTAHPRAPYGQNENLFDVEAPVAGIYPFRLVYWQTDRGANLQWCSVDTKTADRILINDPDDPRALAAYQEVSVPRARAPYLAEVSPLPGSEGNSPAEPIAVLLVDGEGAVQPADVKLYLNGAGVTPQTLSKEADRTTIRYQPNATRTQVTNQVRLEYVDSTGAAWTNAWQFGISANRDPATVVTGQWDFDEGDLRATVGAPLEYLDGTNGLTAAKTLFGATGDLGVADIDGEPARVMYVPGDKDRRIGYVMRHGIAPNGGGLLVNQYSLILDAMISDGGALAASILQIDSLDNLNDGDLFWQGGQIGQGIVSYEGPRLFTEGEWHRLIVAYDLAADPPIVTKFVDGIKQGDWTAYQYLDHPRRALQPAAILFADGDQDERREWWVNSIQIRSGKLSDAECVALGGPSASGIPRVEGRFSWSIQWRVNGNWLALSWPVEATGFTIESSLAVAGPTWSPVAGATNNSVTVPLDAGSRFYRLRR